MDVIDIVANYLACVLPCDARDTPEQLQLETPIVSQRCFGTACDSEDRLWMLGQEELRVYQNDGRAAFSSSHKSEQHLCPRSEDFALHIHMPTATPTAKPLQSRSQPRLQTQPKAQTQSESQTSSRSPAQPQPQPEPQPCGGVMYFPPVDPSRGRYIRLYNLNGLFLRELEIICLKLPGTTYDAPEINVCAVAYDGDSTLYVIQRDYVEILAVDSKTGAVKHAWGSYGWSKDGQLLSPCAIAVSAAKEIYVADSVRCCVHVYNASGEFLRGLVRDGLDKEFLVCPTSLAFDRVGNVLVCDPGQKCVHIFGPNGSFITSFQTRAVRTSATETADTADLILPANLTEVPRYLSVDTVGRIYVSDYHGQVQQFVFRGALRRSP
jgi:hypothetical protein